MAGHFLTPRVNTALNTVSTEDAYVNGHVTFVALLPGQVMQVLVDDNQRVKKGDVLVQLDKEPYQVLVPLKRYAVHAAEANLVAAESKARGLVAQSAPGAGKSKPPWNRSPPRSHCCGPRWPPLEARMPLSTGPRPITSVPRASGKEGHYRGGVRPSGAGVRVAEAEVPQPHQAVSLDQGGPRTAGTPGKRKEPRTCLLSSSRPSPGSSGPGRTSS